MKHAIIALSLLSAASALHAEPSNLTWHKQTLIKYHDSGEYLTEFTQKINEAKTYLDQKLQKNQQLKHPKKLAIVLDIDETSVSNYPAMRRLDFGGQISDINAGIEQGVDPVLKPMLGFYNYAQQHNVSMFFVTGRKEHERNITVKNLEQAGYSAWQKLVLKPESYNQKSVIPFKASARKAIEAQGYQIVESIGDQWSDIKGGYAEKGIKLPNPYYYLP